ncbi:MAG TPA: protein kinase [Rhodocyclaceae bacterium]|nr:protein kinase [Rhodocyclaceae bacterium]
MSDTPDASAAPPPRDDALILPPGYEINEYRIERVLGGGGFGLTYLARDTHLDCRVAIKEYLPRELAGRVAGRAVRPHSETHAPRFERGLQNFLQESRALASFHHRGIVRVLRYFRANDTAYMVMEYETGQPLHKWLVGRLPLDKATLVRIIRPLLEGLEAIHDAGFLHRDIKPGNIYIRADGSPVLLDFGSARRLQSDGADQTLTTVVTPGFAPAEQYHRHGKQGPWTDLYALAGVMYWMVTGRQPIEAFARLKEDIMPSASSLASADIYGGALLRAIDWALDPDENRRPRKVADFRRVCLAPPTGGEGSDAPVEAPLPFGLGSSEARTFIGAVLFADVGEARPGEEDEHKARRSKLATLLGQTVAPQPATTRLAINTREGCAVCYVGDPEDALRTAVQLGDAAAGQGLPLHMGINLGPVRVEPDPKGRSRILGDGITTAFRVMRFAEPGQVLVARTYFDVIQHLKRNAGACFRHLGLRRDPQARDHDVFLYTGEPLPGTVHVAEASRPTQAMGADITPEVVDAAERLLAQHIGPMARILVRKTVPRAASRDELHRLLAALIPDPAPQAAFLSGVLLASGAPSLSAHPATGPVTRGTAAVSAGSAPASSASVAAPISSVIDETDLDRVGKLFARHIGPMAKVLLRREARQANSLETLCRALASHIDKDAERQRFLTDAGFGGLG